MAKDSAVLLKGGAVLVKGGDVAGEERLQAKDFYEASAVLAKYGDVNLVCVVASAICWLAIPNCVSLPHCHASLQ